MLTQVLIYIVMLTHTHTDTHKSQINLFQYNTNQISYKHYTLFMLNKKHYLY